MKKFVHLYIYEEAFYRDAVVQDEVYLTPEIYETIKGKLMEPLFILGLDGEHSETFANIEVQYYSEQELKNHRLLSYPSGDLQRAVKKYLQGSPFSKELDEVYKYVSEIIQKNKR